MILSTCWRHDKCNITKDGDIYSTVSILRQIYQHRQHRLTILLFNYKDGISWI